MWEMLPEAQPFKIRDTSSVVEEFVHNAALHWLEMGTHVQQVFELSRWGDI